MNSQDQDPSTTDLPGDVAPADDAIASPKLRRKRSPRVAPEADSAVAEAASAVNAAAVFAPSVEEVFKPKSRRRKDPDAPAEPVAVTVAVAPALAAEAAAPALGEAATEPAAKVTKPRRRSAPVAADAAVTPDGVAQPGANLPLADALQNPGAAQSVARPTAQPVAESATHPVPANPAQAPAASMAVEAAAGGDLGESANAASTEASAETQGEVAADGDADGPRRRNRNRRRGRRSGADRGVREDGVAAQDTALPKAAAQVGDDDDDDDDDDDERAPQTLMEIPRTAPLDLAETFAAVLSGDFDIDPAEAAVDAAPERRVLAAEPDAPKLHKVLAQAGIGSRRDMEALIAEGQVMVNGQPAHVGQRISFGDRISVAGKVVKVRIAPPPPRIIAYHKPVGEVVTHDDPQHRPTVFRRLPRLSHGKWQSVGRLDINTEGLLLFTNSGELANQLMHPRFGVEREYAVRVLGTLEAEPRQRLLEGVEIDGQRASFKSIEDGGGEGVNRWYRVVITEGRNREVRKLFDKVGLGVSRLIRIRYGCVVLPRGLRRGLFVDLNEAEVREVRRLAAGGREPGAPAPVQQQPAQRAPRQEVQGAGGSPREGQAQPQGGPRGQPNNRRNAQAPLPQRSERPERQDRPARPERQGQGPGQGPRPGGQQPRNNERRERPPARQAERSPDHLADRDRDSDGDRDHVNFAAIPNPLMQTFDKRAIREARAPKREIAEDGPIPNPLEQTYDKRFVQKPRAFGGVGGGGKGGGGGGNGGQPDPMKTSMGYIGADAFVRKFQGNGGGGGGGGGGGRRGGGNYGGGGGGGGRRGGGGR